MCASSVVRAAVAVHVESLEDARVSLFAEHLLATYIVEVVSHAGVNQMEIAACAEHDRVFVEDGEGHTVFPRDGTILPNPP